jgi:hypothetical protein
MTSELLNGQQAEKSEDLGCGKNLYDVGVCSPVKTNTVIPSFIQLPIF